MKLSHKKTLEILPKYSKGSLPAEINSGVELHLKECPDCIEMLSIISELRRIEAPDPGDLFWKTLPKKIKMSTSYSGKKDALFPVKALFVRPISATAVFLILLFSVFIYTRRKEMPEYDPIFNDPIAPAVLDYSDTTRKEIQSITSQLADDLYLPTENFTEHGYHSDLTSLNAEELRSLYEALKDKQGIGG